MNSQYSFDLFKFQSLITLMPFSISEYHKERAIFVDRSLSKTPLRLLCKCFISKNRKKSIMTTIRESLISKIAKPIAPPIILVSSKIIFKNCSFAIWQISCMAILTEVIIVNEPLSSKYFILSLIR